jgi:hypothetical protein
MLITFFYFKEVFQQIHNQQQILRFLTPLLKLVEKIIFPVIFALFANFEAERAQNDPPPKKKIKRKSE